VMVPVVLLVVALGVFPQPVLNRVGPSVEQLVAHATQVGP
jgi:NADH:ubiquinone oxidoreductase subunit 4 (subunit M)